MDIIRGVSNIFTTTMHLDNGLQMWRYFPSPKLKKFQEGYNIFKQACTNHIYQAFDEIKVHIEWQTQFISFSAKIHFFGNAKML